MGQDDEALRRDAKRAYELGRFRASWRSTWLIAAMAVAVHPACSAPALTISAAIALAVLCAVMSWRGEAWGKAVYPGLLAGFLAALAPMAARLFGLCGDSEICALACVLGGIAAGAVVAARAWSLEGDRRRFVLSACLIACIGGSMGCALAGVGGLLGMAVGLLVPTAPALVFQRSMP